MFYLFYVEKTSIVALSYHINLISYLVLSLMFTDLYKGLELVLLVS